MLNVFLLAMSAAAIGSGQPVIFVDERATLRIEIAAHDLSSDREKREVHRKIVWAAGKVCNAGLPGALQIELVACEKEAIDVAQKQFDTLVAQGRSSQTLTGAILVAAAIK